MAEEKKSIKNIENGVVIDHITAGKAMQCIKMINPCTENIIFIGMNLPSSKCGLKDFIKIENYFPCEEDVNKISLIAPNATISTVKDGKIISKNKVKTPSEYSGKIECINPKCVTKTEKYLETAYSIESVKPLVLRCKYCEKTLEEEDVTNQNF